MQIVSDRAMDMSLEQMAGLDIHLAALTLTLDGRTYESGVDIQPDEFYRLLGASEGFPATSQPSPGEFAALYRRLAESDPDILSIHISSGLSGTLAAAQLGASLVPEARVTFFDSKTLSGALGWQVEVAARAVKAGWGKDEVLELLREVRAATETVFTVATLRYLVHGGRISHLKGLLASVLNIKPLIGVDKVSGKYVQRGQARTLKQAILALADQARVRYAPGSALRLQVLHGNNPEGAALLRQRLCEMYDCTWLPNGPIAPVLGAHTGPGLVGLVFAPQAAFTAVPAALYVPDEATG
ncbi:MAG: DegV family protein [Chloroflexi bacterium]|nr:DegV family protein [Chloroflexota bacterium]